MIQHRDPVDGVTALLRSSPRLTPGTTLRIDAPLAVGIINLQLETHSVDDAINLTAAPRGESRVLILARFPVADGEKFLLKQLHVDDVDDSFTFHSQFQRPHTRQRFHDGGVVVIVRVARGLGVRLSNLFRAGHVSRVEHSARQQVWNSKRVDQVTAFESVPQRFVRRHTVGDAFFVSRAHRDRFYPARLLAPLSENAPLKLDVGEFSPLRCLPTFDRCRVFLSLSRQLCRIGRAPDRAEPYHKHDDRDDRRQPAAPKRLLVVSSTRRVRVRAPANGRIHSARRRR